MDKADLTPGEATSPAFPSPGGWSLLHEQDTLVSYEKEPKLKRGGGGTEGRQGRTLWMGQLSPGKDLVMAASSGPGIADRWQKLQLKDKLQGGYEEQRGHALDIGCPRPGPLCLGLQPSHIQCSPPRGLSAEPVTLCPGNGCHPSPSPAGGHHQTPSDETVPLACPQSLQ